MKIAFTRTSLSLAACLVGAWSGMARALPPVPTPPENPLTHDKVFLGKILFWDEQLSSSRTVSCGTCHSPAHAFADKRLTLNPGELAESPRDDVMGSKGVVRSDVRNDYQNDPVFGMGDQLTNRAANSLVNVAYAPELFWDGRAGEVFTDPQTGLVVIPEGGALEELCVAPPVSDIEMAHRDIDWEEIIERLHSVKPVDLAEALTDDMLFAVTQTPTYEGLFEKAFGIGGITAPRVAMALASYLRTLVSDQTPFDLGTMTPEQSLGQVLFHAHSCDACHIQGPTPGDSHFTDFTFANVGLRHSSFDLGRAIVTGNSFDRGSFKIPALRNVALKRTFNHTGQFQTLAEVIAFYARDPSAPQQNTENLDSRMNEIGPIPPANRAALIAFLEGGLTDPRVAAETFPFDKPVLFTERPDLQTVILDGTGVPGTHDERPTILASDPAMIGNPDFRVGVNHILRDVLADLLISRSPPAGRTIIPDLVFRNVPLDLDPTERGTGTFHWTLAPGSPMVDVHRVFVQWMVPDPQATGGRAFSPVAMVTMFCGRTGCPSPCDGIDFNNDSVSPDTLDLEDFLSVFGGGPCSNDPNCGDIDFNNDGVSPDTTDIDVFLNAFAGGTC